MYRVQFLRATLHGKSEHSGGTWLGILLPFCHLFSCSSRVENTDLFAGVAISSTVFCVGVIAAAWIWIVYRAIRGLIALNDNRPMYQ